ncbi:MAG: DNA repair protein RecO [Firmicutes bacterium]|nr:DNA repair protein RecO [Bacillota bacterium]
MEQKIKALCVKALKWKDNDFLLTLISAERGKLIAKIKSPKSPKAKLRLASSPLCFGEYIITQRGGTHSVIGCTVIENFFSCWQDIDKYGASQIVCEVLDKLTHDGVDTGRELVLAVKSLSEIDSSGNEPLAVAVEFVKKMLLSLGVDCRKDGLSGEKHSSEDSTEAVKLLNKYQHIIKNNFGEKINSIAVITKIVV